MNAQFNVVLPSLTVLSAAGSHNQASLSIVRYRAAVARSASLRLCNDGVSSRSEIIGLMGIAHCQAGNHGTSRNIPVVRSVDRDSRVNEEISRTSLQSNARWFVIVEIAQSPLGNELAMLGNLCGW